MFTKTIKQCNLRQLFSTSKTWPTNKKEWDHVKTSVSKIRDLQAEFLF